MDPARWVALGEFDHAAGSLRREIANDFLAALPGHCAAMEQAAATTDFDALAQAAHLLKGAAQNLGAQALGALCDRVETAARQQQVAARELDHLQATADQTRQALGLLLSSP